ncbi:MAG: thiamine-phosphate kinase [Proteobacteria bacterium]|nr:thiamine-phosphate kinase [Pseudomonadota bacterium]MBU1710595.1 thiamine-phosphate kinase [Pseudomonadota bacterium]
MGTHSSERQLIESIRKQVDCAAPTLVRGIGDDCAVFMHDSQSLSLMTVDTLIESVHFDLSWHPPDLLGRKAASVNISDIAAMGGKPRFVLLSLGLSGDQDDGWVDAFIRGFTAVLDEYGAKLIGGDTVKSPGRIMLSVTVYGEVDADKVLYRSGAKKDDSVWVSGFLGEAAAGLELCRNPRLRGGAEWQSLVSAHINPSPQIQLGGLLAASGLVSAMMDLSDGLATDLAHLCTASNVGAEIVSSRIPVSTQMARAATLLGYSPFDWALKGGEDYHLLFTAPGYADDSLSRLVKDTLGSDIFCVGRIVEEPGVRLIEEGGAVEIGYQGFDHFSR